MPETSYIERVSKMEETKGDAGEVAKQVVSDIEVEIETTVSKSTVKPFQPGTDARVSFAEKVLRPKVTVKRQGNVLYVSAPFGEPRETSGVVKAVGVALGLGFVGAIFGAGRLSKRKR